MLEALAILLEVAGWIMIGVALGGITYEVVKAIRRGGHEQ